MLTTGANAGTEAPDKWLYSKPCSIVTWAEWAHQVIDMLSESDWVARVKAEEGGFYPVVSS